MIQKKIGRRLLGTLVAAGLGSMALAATAQALTPTFLINHKVSLGGEIGAKQVGRSTLLVPSLNVEFNCERFTLSGLISSGTDASGKLLFEECTVLDIASLEEIPGCEVVADQKLGVQKPHITATSLILPAELANGEPAILVEKIEATIVLHEGLGCVLPLSTKMTGELCFKIDNNDQVEPLILASQAILCRERTSLEASTEGAGFKDKLRYGVQEAFIDMTAHLFLTGVHKGLPLGVCLQ